MRPTCSPDVAHPRCKQRAAIFHVNSANAGQLVANHLCALGWTYVDKEQLAEARAERGEASWLQRGKERGLGWRAERILEWRVNPSLVDYDAMIAGGSDSANMLPDGYLTRKDGLAETLNAWGDSMGPQCAQAVNTRLVPQTFLLADAGECSAFVKQVEEEPGTWYILKPSKGYGGNGLAVWPSQGALDATTARFLGRGNACPADKPSVAQRYLREPLLLDGRKWDLRMYAVLARVDPPVAYYARGHARLSLEAYNESKSDLGVHLTNTNVAKKSADYNPESAEEHNWSIDRLKAHLRSLGSAHAAFADSLEPQIKRMMVTTLAAGHARWADGSAAADNVFQVFGFDFMVTTDLRVWLIEVNKNPLYWPTTRTKLPTTPALVRDTLDVVTTLQTARLAGLTAGCHELAGRRNGTLQPIIDGDWNYGLIQGCV